MSESIGGTQCLRFAGVDGFCKQHSMLNSNVQQKIVVYKDYEEVFADHQRLVRELDIALNGDGAAKQASLCDIVKQVKDKRWILVSVDKIETLKQAHKFNVSILTPSSVHTALCKMLNKEE